MYLLLLNLRSTVTPCILCSHTLCSHSSHWDPPPSSLLLSLIWGVLSCRVSINQSHPLLFPHHPLLELGREREPSSAASSPVPVRTPLLTLTP